MLFEQEGITPGKRAGALNRLFNRQARREGESPAPEHVPVEVLAAHGELERHLRYMLESATHAHPSAEARRHLRRIEKLLDSLPESIMQTLPASPSQDWMRCYRDLVRLHELLDDAGLCVGVEEYATIIEKMTRLADAVSSASSVQVTAASMFTLWLMQAHLRRYQPRRRRHARKTRPDKRKRRHAHHPRKTEESAKGL